jgi:serine protease Do
VTFVDPCAPAGARLPRLCLKSAAAAALLVLAAFAGAPAAAAPPPDSFADLAARLLPAVVNVSTTQSVGRPGVEGPEIPQFPPGSPFEEFFRDFFERQQRGQDNPARRATSLGSGFIISADGFVVTNNHVIAEADEITVILADDTNLHAELVGIDDKTDLALLKVDAGRDLPFVTWGDSNAMRVGDWVIAIGNPFGLGGSVTAGIISAFGRDINAGPYDDFMQTDASINRGNSGGPMFNLDGEVIGINTAIFSPTGGSVGIGFAIPSSLSRPVIEQLMEFGRTRRGWLGVRIQGVTDEIAESLGLESAEGALVASVTEGGPAAEAGIEAGDVIVEFDGHRVGEMRRLPRLVADTSVDKTVPVRIWRRGEYRTVDVQLGELEEAEENGMLAALPDGEEPGGGATRTIDTVGMTIAGLTDQLRQEFSVSDEVAGGVVITEVAPGSLAEEKGLAAGEVIVEVGQEAVGSPADVVRMIEEARDAGRKSVLLLVERGGDLRFVALPVREG